jgi:hypothetical protein
MKLITNSGTERVLDELRTWQTDKTPINIMSPCFSVHAFDEVADQFEKAADFRLILGNDEIVAQGLFGGPNETAMRAKLKGRWLAKRASAWLKKSAKVGQVNSAPPQSLIVGGPIGAKSSPWLLLIFDGRARGHPRNRTWYRPGGQNRCRG